MSVITKHTCFLPVVQKYHRNITCAFVASEMYAHVIDNLTYEPRSIIRHIEETYKYTISYAKAWRAKQKIIEMRFGTYEASYDNLPRLLGVIEGKKPWELLRNERNPHQLNILARFSCIDGTFLTGKYRGQILTAIGVDGNNQVLPLAFAFVESENTYSWYWFLKLVKTKVVSMRPNVCLIHDRHADILRAIEELQFGSMERGYLGVWDDVQSRWCMRHMGANFFKQFNNKELMNMFQRLCNQNQEKKFNELWKRLDELTAKCSDQRAAAPSTAVDDPSQALGPLPTDSPTLVEELDWRFENFLSGFCMNQKRNGPRSLQLGDARCPWTATSWHSGVHFTWDMQKKLEELRKKAMKHRALVQGTQQHRFEILCQDKAGRGIYRKRVKQECVLKADSIYHCSCSKPKLLHRPCTHVIAAAAECGIPDAVYVSQYFSKQAIYHTWSGEIYGFGIAGEFIETNDEVLNIPDPSKLRGKAGRRRTRRIRNNMDESEAGRVKRCSKCDERGHTYKHCPKDKEKPSAAEAGLSGSAADGARPMDGTSGYTSTVGSGDRSPTPVSPYCGAGGSAWDVPGTDMRLREAGLLPMCRLVEAAAGHVDPARRWTMDRSLLAALVDRWRPETHTFHLPCGEVAPTLQDVSYLLGLPLAGDAVGPVTTAADWQDDLMARFALVQRAPHLPLQPLAHHRNTGPTKRWLLQFTGHAVDKGLVHYARSIADAAVGEVPQWSWGSALLAALYRGLCEACTKTDPSATFGGCPLFLSIWAAERIAIGRPEVDQHAYEESLYEERPEVDYPTMGTLWCRRQAAYFSHAAGSASQPAASTSHSAQFQQYTGASSQAAGTSSQGPPLDHAGTSSDRLLSSTVLFDITDFDFASGSAEDVIGPSQLGGAPPVQTQDQAQATPPPDTRATRAVPPDRFTYSQDHVRAQARRTKRGRGAGQGQ
uniref:OSJNBa0083D01.11 protein n=1 Tax=Oryza sativa subsp. japonica TaxID=39947 RepID=Q7XVE8_ORYSJ|nr:OSJNBa0083D01.11 [Oryza sativa Japonica Group]